MYPTNAHTKPNGRPKGTTNKRKHLEELALMSTENEIHLSYEGEVSEYKKKKKRMKRGRLIEIINKVRKNNNL